MDSENKMNINESNLETKFEYSIDINFNITKMQKNIYRFLKEKGLEQNYSELWNVIVHTIDKNCIHSVDNLLTPSNDEFDVKCKCGETFTIFSK